MQDVADLLQHPRPDGIASASELMREVRVQAFHAIRRSSTDTAGALQDVHRIASRDVVRVGGFERGAELRIALEPLVHLAHAALGLELPGGSDRTPAREPVQRGERLAVDEWMRLDHRRQAAAAAHGDAYLATQAATELTLDRRVILV
jgi:hypothetical protein